MKNADHADGAGGEEHAYSTFGMDACDRRVLLLVGLGLAGGGTCSLGTKLGDSLVAYALPVKMPSTR